MSSTPRHVVVVVNPAKFDGDTTAVRALVIEAASAFGGAVPDFIETTRDDPGFGQARAAVNEGADLVCALGGDGTVRAVAGSLAGTGTALGLLPGGTGNLLARNLNIPFSDLAEAVRVAWAGRDRRIDVGWVQRDDAAPEMFAVMAGAGFDAAIMGDAPAGLKDKVGWAAYVVAAARNLRGEPYHTHVTVDGADAGSFDARTVVVGNCGTLQGGIELFPQAQVDDGVLDAVVLTPKSLAAWASAATALVGDGSDSPHLERMTGRDIIVQLAPPQKVQLDGEVFPEAARLSLRVDRQALVVRVPNP